MKLITNQTDLEKNFLRLIKDYQKLYWTTAWAGLGSRAFEGLKNAEHKIKKISAGIHFYQTHPDFIETFLSNKNVRYILQPEGTFHPKMYLFVNADDDWELLVGSANFTAGAFRTNKEATILLSQEDDTSKVIYKQAMKFIDETWSSGEGFTRKELEKYRLTWRNLRPQVSSLSGQFGDFKAKPTPIHQAEIVTTTWQEFIAKVLNEKDNVFRDRLRVLEIAKDLFTSEKHFDQLDEDERKFIAGIPNNLSIEGAHRWACFGSMSGNGIFKNRIIENELTISKALDQIPITGQITRKRYEEFIRYYKQAFSGTKLENANTIGTASRLLAMKRPDIFVCVDSANKVRLSSDFGISQRSISLDSYWDVIIERIYVSEWWQNPNPVNSIERKVNEARAAFLDSFYYEPRT